MTGFGIRLVAILASLSGFFRGDLLSQESYEGRRIAEIRFDPELQPMAKSELLGLLPFRTGDVLRRDQLRSAIGAIYRVGRYADIAVDAAPRNGEVALTFITTSNWFVGSLAVQGVSEPPGAGQLLNAAKLPLGEEFTSGGLNQALENMQLSLRTNGFYESRVTPVAVRDNSTQQVDVRFVVEPGERAKFSEPVIRGSPGKPLSKIVGSTDWKRWWGLRGWKTVTDRRVSSGLDHIRSLYQKQNHLMSRVTLEGMQFQPQTQTVIPTLNVDAGPQVLVRAAGAKVSSGKLKQLVPVYQERAVDRDLLLEGGRNLTEHFLSQGYFDALVEFDSRSDDQGRQLIEYSIDRGERYKLMHLEISGNRYFPTETLRERVEITPATLLRYRNGRFSDRLLERDRNAIADLYRTNGFLDVQVLARVEDDFRGREREQAVFLEVREGPQWLVSKLELTGVEKGGEDYIRSLLRSAEGQPYSDQNITSDRDTVLNAYYNNGFPEATFEWTLKPGAEPNRMELRFVVQEGPRRFVRRVLVGGLRATNRRLVYSRIPLEPGDPLSQSRMLDGQRRLYDLGIFARVDMALQNPEGAEENKYVLYQVEEARRYSVSGGLGAEIARIGGGDTSFDAPAGGAGFSPRVSFGISRGNFFGIGHTLGLQTQVSTIQRRALLTYLAPQFKGNENFTLTFYGLYDDARNVRTFNSRRLEGSAQLGQRLSLANSLQYRFAYRRVSIVEETLKIQPALIPILSQPVRVGIISASFIQDRRDDPIDSHKGVYNTIDFGLASRAFASESDFFRLLGRNSTYHRLGRDLVLARTLTVGWMHNLSGDPTRDVPLPERFYSGGANSHRGFPENQAGPRDPVTGFPVGGKALLMNAVELRFPLIGANLGGVVFHDAGNIYTRLRDLSLRYRQRDLTDFDYMVHAVGFGIRYRTPVGPVRLDLAFGPNSPRFFGFRGTREELLRGEGTSVVQRVNRFQFHFSLGQTF